MNTVNLYICTMPDISNIADFLEPVNLPEISQDEEYHDGQAGKEILGERVYASMTEIPEPFQMVDIFRASEAAGGVVDEAITLKNEKGVEVIWMQLGVRNVSAAERAEAAGLKVVMNRCPKIEFGRLNAELAWGGFDTRVITARRRKVRLT